LLAGYQAEKKTLMERMTAITAEFGKTCDNEENLKKLKLLSVIYADSTELTAEIVNKLIECIELKPLGIVDGKRTHELNINYRFINEALLPINI